MINFSIVFLHLPFHTQHTSKSCHLARPGPSCAVPKALRTAAAPGGRWCDGLSPPFEGRMKGQPPPPPVSPVSGPQDPPGEGLPALPVWAHHGSAEHMDAGAAAGRTRASPPGPFPLPPQASPLLRSQPPPRIHFLRERRRSGPLRGSRAAVARGRRSPLVTLLASL